MADANIPRHIAYDLGIVAKGKRVTIPLSGTECNVFLVSPTGYSSYKARRSYTLAGGHFKQSPARIDVPRTAHWIAVVDLGGAIGKVRVGQPKVA